NVQVMKNAFEAKLGYKSHTTDYEREVEQVIALDKSGATADELLTSNLSLNYEFSQGTGWLGRVGGIKCLDHEMGCGGTRADSDALCGLLAGYITHPNVAGATVLSLGCQHAQATILRDEIVKRDPDFNKPLYIFEQQLMGTEANLIQEAIRHTFVGLVAANQQARRPAPLSKLCVGLECGGSDGFSGISA